ncbi:hypothetical protein ABZ543_08280 [Streptomyces roseifaciens]
MEFVGVLLGGMLALAGSLGAASLQARHQRKHARASELWNRRAELYLDLLTHLRGTVSFAADSDPLLVAYGPQSGEDYQLRHELRARVTLFASQEVRDLWARAADAALHLHAEVFEGDHVQRVSCDRVIIPETGDPEYVRLLTADKEARARLASRLRTELEVDKYLAA